jgi:ribosomal-protein-alanine N-acetyltransferase
LKIKFAVYSLLLETNPPADSPVEKSTGCFYFREVIKMENLFNSKTDNFYFPQVETERLLLRMFEPNDLDAATVLFNDAEVQKYLSPKNKRNREQLVILLEKCRNYWKERGFGVWCIAEKNVGKMIGYCGFQYFDKTPEIEIVFGFLKEHWGKGYAGESAAAGLKYAFEKLSLNQIFAATHQQNIASRRVLEKLQMRLIEETGHYELNTVTYSISQSEYKAHEQFYEKGN